MKRPWSHVLFWLSIWIFKSFFQFTLNRSFYQHLPFFEQIYFNFLPEFFLTLIKVGICYVIAPLYRGSNWKLTGSLVIQISIVFLLGVVFRQLFLSIYIDFYNPTTPLVNQKVFLDPSRIMNSVIDNGFVLGVFLVLKTNRVQLQWVKREQSLIRENLETELNFLRSQINPHFLFNTLNNFYSMAQGRGHWALADGILQLSDLMRYSLYDSNNHLISIAKEISYIESYINLTKLRYQEEELVVDFQCNLGTKNLSVPPMILVPLVENALKYGISINKKSTIRIEVNEENGRLTFFCQNPKHYQAMPERHGLKGIGLSNVRRRLELIYPQRHTLVIDDAANFYRVTLTIY